MLFLLNSASVIHVRPPGRTTKQVRSRRVTDTGCQLRENTEQIENPGGGEAIVDKWSPSFGLKDADVAKRAKVVRDERLRHPEFGHNLRHRPLFLADRVDDPQAVGICECM